jgi:hypothetical protein
MKLDGRDISGMPFERFDDLPKRDGGVLFRQLLPLNSIL